jgi:RimJ/RimL family protein N-acetyltransferase
MVFARIETERLVLRPLTLDDVDTLVALDADPEVMRYITGGRPTPRDEVVDIVRRRIGRRWMGHERPTPERASPEPTHAEFVGWFGLVPSATRDAEFEVGYRLRRDAWGKGLATEGARALIDLAFTELDARRIWAETMAVNVRSRAVMERCGLHYGRTFHLDFDDPIDGTELGEVEYELSRAEWERLEHRAR